LYDGDMNTLVTQLREQHEHLRSAITSVTELGAQTPFPAQQIATALTSFKTQLDEHLAIEDTTFYPELLRAMKADEMDASVTEEFISQMAAIGAQVYGFLARYGSQEYLTSHAEQFRSELADIVHALAARMYAEDRSVYALYEQLHPVGVVK
jgi:regulator of sigma D